MSLAGWQFYNKITIDNTSNSNALTDYQVKISLDNTNFDFSKAQTNGEDIRILDSDNSTPLDFWIEKWDNTNQVATLLTKVPSISASSTKQIYLYFGNSSATSASNAANTFNFYSDGSSLTNWTNNGATVNSSNGNPEPSLEATGGTYAYINAGLTPNMAVDLDVWVISGAIDLCNFYFLTDSSGEGQMIRLDARSKNYSDFAATTSWTGWGTPTSGETVSAGVWHHVQLLLGATQVHGYIDGAETATSPYTFANNGGYIAVHGDSAGVTGGDFDNIKIRKYVSPEPTTSVGKLQTNGNAIMFGMGF